MSSGFRERFFFWLDVRKPDEFEVTELISELKRQRAYTSAIRDGIRLIVDLRAGRVGVLLELFPWVATALGGQTPAPRPISPPPLAEDDESLLVVKSAESTGDSALNFLDSVFKLQ